MAEEAGPPDEGDAAEERHDPIPRDVADAIKQLVRSGEAEPVDRLPSSQELERREKHQRIKLKDTYGRNLLWGLFVQMGVADAVFIAYAWAGQDWDLEPTVIEIWMAATVVRMIGVIYVVTRNLFPPREDTT